MAAIDLFYAYSRNVLELSSYVWDRALEIAIQPSINKDMLIILLPLIATMFVMQLYFSRYRREELGWGSAFGNSAVLLFVGISLLAYLLNNSLFYFTNKTDMSMAKTLVVSVVIIESISLTITNFFHSTSKRLAYRLSSVFFLNFIAIISVILVYSNVSFDYITLISSILIFFILSLSFEIIKMVIPEHLFGEFKEIKESMKEEEVQLKEVEVEKKEAEKDEMKKKKDELIRERKKIREERERKNNQLFLIALITLGIEGLVRK